MPPFFLLNNIQEEVDNDDLNMFMNLDELPIVNFYPEEDNNIPEDNNYIIYGEPEIMNEQNQEEWQRIESALEWQLQQEREEEQNHPFYSEEAIRQRAIIQRMDLLLEAKEESISDEDEISTEEEDDDDMDIVLSKIDFSEELFF